MCLVGMAGLMCDMREIPRARVDAAEETAGPFSRSAVQVALHRFDLGCERARHPGPDIGLQHE